MVRYKNLGDWMLSKQKRLSNDKIILKKLTLSDTESLHAMLNDEMLVAKAGLVLHSHISQTLAFILEHNNLVRLRQQYFYGIYQQTTLVGVINFFNLDYLDKSGEFGYFIGSNYQRRGYMLSAIKLLSNYLLIENKIEKIYIYVDVDNKPSLKLIEKLKLKQINTSLQEDLSMRFVYMNQYVINKPFNV